MPESRSSAIDVAKGLAILGVVFIHAELLTPSLLQSQTLNRAVPIFFVLFGLTSTLWWEKTPPMRRIAGWYRSRFVRLLPAYWLSVALWWIAERLLSSQPIGVDVLLFALVGYAPWIQTSWFVTAILQIIVAFPLLKLVSDGLGRSVAIVAAIVAVLVCQYYAIFINLWIKDLLPYPEHASGFYPFWLFAPQYLWLVLCGMRMTRLVRARDRSALIVAAVVAVAAAIAEPLLSGSSLMVRTVATLADPARTVVLLAASSALTRIDRLRRALSWLGRNSWEIYVGQMSVHSLAYPAWVRAGGPLDHRFEYLLVLLVSGVGFAFALAEVRKRLQPASA